MNVLYLEINRIVINLLKPNGFITGFCERQVLESKSHTLQSSQPAAPAPWRLGPAR